MITKGELLSALIARRAITRYVTVKELLKDPALWGMKPKTLGVKLLRLRRQGLVKNKKFGKEYGYKLTQKGLKRHDYFYEKRKTEREVKQFKRRLNEEYNLLLLKILETKKEKEKRDLIEIAKLIMGKD